MLYEKLASGKIMNFLRKRLNEKLYFYALMYL